MNLSQIVNFQEVMNQIARERRAAQQTIETVRKMREWQQQIRLYSELRRRYYLALSEHDIITAEKLLDVLTDYQPRYQA